jgi:hypothetical protein
LFPWEIVAWGGFWGCPVLSGCVRISPGLLATAWRRPGRPPCDGRLRRRWVDRLGKRCRVASAAGFGCQGAGPVVWAGGVGCGVSLVAKTQFARRLIIGFGGAKTNHGRRMRADLGT